MLVSETQSQAHKTQETKTEDAHFKLLLELQRPACKFHVRVSYMAIAPSKITFGCVWSFSQ